MSMPKVPDRPPNYMVTSQYSINDGVVEVEETLMGDVTRHIIEVRSRIEEQALREAVIFELRRLGYTVVPPETDAVAAPRSEGWDT